MSSLTDRFQYVVLDLVRRFGKPCIIRKIYQSFDEDDPTNGTYKTQDYKVEAAVIEYEKDQIDGVQVLRGDKQIVVAKTPEAPNAIKPGDFFIDGQYEYKIIPNVQIYCVNGSVIAWQLQGRM